jgi:beta-fructofuranosidase
MNFFYKPRPGVIGDCIPHHYAGRYHVFFLRNYRDLDSYGIGGPWHHISTTDFVHFEDHGEAIPKGAIFDQDMSAATGCVYTDDNGKHHIFYTGINSFFRNEAQHEQVLLYATSDDLMTWNKVPGKNWYADEAIYERHDWRDPFVFKHPQSGRYYMLVAARTNQGPTFRRGCTGLLTSDDLQNWTLESPFYAPGQYHGHECPDWFQLGDWYYLVFSEYTTHTVTRYVMSHSPDGPWMAPDDNQFDNRAFYAAKTASDGSRRFLFGWNPTKLGDVDHGEWQWGGCLTVHEILQQPDGALVVRMPPEVDHAFSSVSTVRLSHLEPGWTRSDAAYRAESLYGYTIALGEKMPETYLLQGELVFEQGSGSAGVLLQMDENGDTGYFLRFNLKAQRLEFGKVGGYRSWYVDHMPELDRPLDIGAGFPVRFKIIVDKTAMVAYVNDRVALSARMYSNPHGRCGLIANCTTVSATDLQFRTFWRDRLE